MWILFIILMISFSYWLGDASTATNTVSSSNDFSFLTSLIDLFNIIWLPFAVIAWKLFTNTMAYGANFHLDAVLFKIWQFSRTLANYIIGFILIIWIFGIFVWKTKNILSLLWKITIASVLVNASWFLMEVLLDISTILLIAMGSLPMHIMWSSSTWPTQKIQYCSNIEISPKTILENKNGYKNITVCNKWDIKKMDADEFFAKMNDMSWPLIFIWTSILNVDKNWWISSQYINENSNVKKSMSIKVVLHMLIVLLFVVPIILLVIIWIVRLFWLWIYIWFSPLIVLDHIFGWKSLWTKTQFKISNIIGLIFQPVIVVMAMWISIIFLSAVQTSFIWEKQDEIKKSLWICLEWKSLCIHKKPVVTVKWNLFENFMDEVGGLFGYIIITILTFALLWWLLKLAFHSTEITSSIADRTFKFAEEWMKTIPIVPIWKWQAVWIWAIKRAFDSRLLKRWFATQTSEQAAKITDWLAEKVWVGESSLWPNIVRTYEDYFAKDMKFWGIVNTSAYSHFAKFIEDIKTNKWDIIPNQNTDFKRITKLFLEAAFPGKSFGEIAHRLWWLDKKKATIDDLFNNARFATFLTNVIKDPNILKWNTSTMDVIYSRNQAWNHLLGIHIKDIK